MEGGEWVGVRNIEKHQNLVFLKNIYLNLPIRELIYGYKKLFVQTSRTWGT